MFVKDGELLIAQRTQEISGPKLRQIADILGIRGRYQTATITFIKKLPRATKAKKTSKKP